MVEVQLNMSIAKRPELCAELVELGWVVDLTGVPMLLTLS